MPYVEVVVRKSKPRVPPRDATRSRVWHACCLSCYRSRGGRRPAPAGKVPVAITCCFCKETLTTYRIRLAGRTAIPCSHVQYHARGL